MDGHGDRVRPRHRQGVRRQARIHRVTYGDSVLDLQSNKIDLAFALNPTPQRALVIAFTQPFFIHGFGAWRRRASTPKTWDDIDKPESDRRRPRLRCTSCGAALRPEGADHAFKTRDECDARVQTGRADMRRSWPSSSGLTTVAKNPRSGKYQCCKEPLVRSRAAWACAPSPTTRWRECPRRLDRLQPRHRPDPRMAVAGLALNGVQPEDIPPEVDVLISATIPSPAGGRGEGEGRAQEPSSATPPPHPRPPAGGRESGVTMGH